MVQFNDWCNSADTPVGNRHLRIMRGRPAESASRAHPGPTGKARGRQPGHRPVAPQTRQIRSGDLGEIYATEWVNAHSGYRAPIKRLRWKDHRNMAMRGDDVIGMIQDLATQRVRFLKTEAQSRTDLRAQTLEEALYLH